MTNPATAEKVREALEQTARDLGEHRQTHVVWRDWLLKDPANENVNPHAGSAEFHAGVVLDYDRHLSNIAAAIAELASLQRERDGRIAVLRETADRATYRADEAERERDGFKQDAERWEFVARRFQHQKTSEAELFLSTLGLHGADVLQPLAAIIDTARGAGNG